MLIVCHVSCVTQLEHTVSAMNSITMKHLHSIPLGELPQQTAIFPGEITINKNIFYTINLLSLASVK
jgi:hypothetical protein